MNISLTEWPREADWKAVKDRALVTVGLLSDKAPTTDWKKAMLKARHSPIRRLRFSFYLEDIPYWVSVHLCRHIHAQPYVRTQRNDRQKKYDRNAARQDAPVSMIWDMNAEEFLTICNKRLCLQAAPETREVVERMVYLVLDRCPEFYHEMVPACERQGGVCHEMFPCPRKDDKEECRKPAPETEKNVAMCSVTNKLCDNCGTRLCSFRKEAAHE